MDKPENIALLAFNGVQILDITGPAAVFAAANDALGREFYRVHILSADGGVVRSNSAVRLETKKINDVPATKVGVLLIAGGDTDGLRELAINTSAKKWVLKASAQARRFGSICTGAFVLADFGLIDGKRVATHWSACRRAELELSSLPVCEAYGGH
jgi:transcriptional regulator GlxA family with amidase domain